ncbi:MAG: membrane protein insertase YidC [Anaerolineales bacterium]|nr:membrane protein insertase YidC [Anaerolineales bacterium]
MWEQFIAFFTTALLWIYSVVGHNFGIAIILFTILIRVVTWPLTAQQLKGAQAMQELQNDPEWLKIQKKYEKDKEKLAQEQMRIYKERGINPFGSCLPTLVQFPIIIALYQSVIRALATTPLQLLQLARTPWLGKVMTDVAAIIPVNSQFLWMDLARPEGIPFPAGFAIDFLPNGFPTLALIVAATTYIQSKLTMPAPSTKTSGSGQDQSAMMSSMMSIYMPLLLGYFALTFPSGLSVYFITSNLLGIFQYAIQGRANWRNIIPGANKTQ